MGGRNTKLSRKATQDISELLEDSQNKFSKDDLEQMWRNFTEEYPSGLADKTAWRSHCALIKKNAETADAFFQVMDRDGNGSIDFKEWIFFLSVFTKGNPRELIEFTFKMYDANGDGFITREEMKNALMMVNRKASSAGEGNADQNSNSNANANSSSSSGKDKNPTKEQQDKQLEAIINARIEKVFSKADVNRDGMLSLEELLQCVDKNPDLVSDIL